ncbi:MAG: TorF family putative porin [Phycisphaerales bacterium]
MSLDLTYTDQYFFRGIVQETDGFIIQPAIEIGVELYEGEHHSLSGYVGMWSSFHDNKTGSTQTDNFTSTWYEFDFYAGLSLSMDRITADLVYTGYTSPNGAFGSVGEISIGLSLDDSGLWGDTEYGIAPYALVAFEVGANEADGGTNSGTFLAVGIEPSTALSDVLGSELTISFPVEAGFSLSDYYEVAGSDESFGYLTAGVAASFPLEFVDDGFGEWSFHAGVNYLLLGDNTETINAGDDSEWIFHAGIGVAF